MTKKHFDNATINDLAHASGVSVMTISRFFNQPQKVSDRTKKKIEAAIEKVNYHPNVIARSLITKKSYTIGVVVPDIRNPFFNTIYHEIDQYFKPQGYNLLLCNTQEDPEEEIAALRTLLSRSVDGVIISPVSIKAVEFLQAKKSSFVLVDRKFDDVETPYIGCDHYNGMREAVEYLIQLGHKEIALISGSEKLSPFAKRTQAYKDVLGKNNIPFNPEFLFQVDITDPQKAYDVALKLLDTDKSPTAVVAANNNIGMGALKAFFEKGISIPDDLSFIVFDKITGYDLIKPRITCVVQPIEFIGKNAAGFLLDMLKNESTKINRAMILPEIVHGESCKKVQE